MDQRLRYLFERVELQHVYLAGDTSGMEIVTHPATVYECPACGTRLLGEQRCADCGVFCRRIGPGGACPHCDEPVAVVDLLPDTGPQ